MSVIGKGRGRGFAEVRETALRRPGQLFPSKFNDLINLIDGLSIKDITSGTKIDDIVETINDSIKNNSLNEVFDDLHKQALEDRQFGIKLSLACCDAKVYSINENSLRLILLQKLQSDYEEREEIKKKNMSNYRNAIALLGEVYSNLRIGGKPVEILATPLLQYLESLLETSEEEDIELVTNQIFINGQKIFQTIPTELDFFIMRVRLVLINRNISARSRGMLLFIIDFANQNYIPLSEKLRAFYSNEISNDILSEILNHEKNFNADLKSKNNVVYDKGNPQFNNEIKIKPVQPNADSSTIGTSVKSAKQGKTGFGATEKSPPKAVSERPTPRAIRGAGAADSVKDRNTKKSPRGKKDKVTDEQIWSSKQNTNSKVWGHDDRFEKDYE